MAWCDLCAGIQTTLPESTRSATSPSAAWAIIVHTRARGLSWCVAQAVPATAVVSSAWQSVRMGGTKGQWTSTSSRAQASAAAAVSHHEGGQPRP